MLSRVITAFRNVIGFEVGLSREQMINQICLLIFVPAAIVVLGHVELQQFALRFWISLALVGMSLLVSTQRLHLFLVLSAFLTLRFGIAVLKKPDMTRVLVTLLSAGFTYIILRIAVSREEANSHRF